MPIRFQVDPDFYDHPKTIDASDAAVALWTRAGSYSTAKHLDGFVPEAMLARLTATPEAAGELVRRGLWRRVKGGFQFHEWDQRNLTRAEIDADRQYERERKRRRRAEQNGQVKADPVPPGQPPGLPGGQHRDSQRNPSGSVSVSVSESVSGSGRGEPPPSGPRPEPACREHQDDPDPPACRRCKAAREAAEAWDAAYAVSHAMADARARDTRPQCRRHQGQLAANCAMCRAERLGGVDD